ncbi:MAG: hypothetical protein DSY42_05740, partial [Aquifex sp.]
GTILLEVDTLGKELSLDEKEVLKDVEDTEREIEEYLRLENELGEFSELEGEEENPNEVLSVPIDSLSGESYELSIELDTPIDTLDGEEALALAELYGELSEAQELGFFKKLFRKIRKAFKKVVRFIKRKPLKALIIGSAVVGGTALAHKYGLFSKAKAWLRNKYIGFRNWLRWKKWQIRRALVRMRWLAKVRKLKRKHPRTWFSRLKRYWRRRIILRIKNQLNRYWQLWRRRRKRIYLNAYRRLLKGYRRLIGRRTRTMPLWIQPFSWRRIRRPVRIWRRPIRRPVRAYRHPVRPKRTPSKPIPAIMPIRTHQRTATTTVIRRTQTYRPIPKTVTPTPMTPAQNKGLQDALMPLMLFTGGFMLFRMLRG